MIYNSQFRIYKLRKKSIEKWYALFADINECSSDPCLHGASCVDKVNGYECECTDGWKGPQCQLDANKCSGSPCINARTCRDIDSDYICECQTGWSGKKCDIGKINNTHSRSS